jgi:hypothetical protein
MTANSPKIYKKKEEIMAQNDYQTFGDSGTDGVNKLSLANYTADNDRVYGNGYTTKVIRSQLVNKVLHQTSKISAAVAQLMANNGFNALDTDNVATLASNLYKAIWQMTENLQVFNLTNTDANTINRTGVAVVGIGNTNLPPSAAFLSTIYWSSTNSTQICHGYDSSFWIRRLNNNQGWTPWSQLASTVSVHLAIAEDLNATGSAPMYACRAWANFDGTQSPPTIRASGNVSSITKNGTGDYTINFITAMPDANYAFLGTSSDANEDNVGPTAVGAKASSYVPSATSRRFETAYQNSNYDSTWVNVAIFR